ncbi:MAG: chemotaxis protein CheD [Armatimonadota bacterium]
MAATTDRDTELQCLGLGSCIAVCMYEKRLRWGLMVHVVLPSTNKKDGALPGKYADTAIPLILSEMKRAGVRSEQARVVLCGGAAIFPSLEGIMDIGQRNLAAVRDGLKAHGLRVVREEVGGRESRTLSLHVGTGQVRMRTVRTGEQILVNLGE